MAYKLAKKYKRHLVILVSMNSRTSKIEIVVGLLYSVLYEYQSNSSTLPSCQLTASLRLITAVAAVIPGITDRRVVDAAAVITAEPVLAAGVSG